ncbi:MAG TPA: alpha/beta hydrolase [Rhodocyclaceae bacterium]|nr:alpha/beta hydrolase [Rhodocyclaceae bacterium]
MYQYFYFPDRVKYDTPARLGLHFDDMRFNSRDGTQLAGWFIHATGAIQGTVIHMHGNAQNMSAHWGYVDWLPTVGFNVFTFDYRGYGNSQGSPDPRGVFEDAIAALDAIRARENTGPLFVFGQSLGGMLAIAAAGASPAELKAVAAEAPVHSYSAWAEDVMPEKELALDDTYCASEYIAALSPVPLLLLHGTADRVVPYEHSERLLKAAGTPKQLVTLPNGEHNDALTERHGDQYRRQLLDFFSTYA